LGTAAQDGDDDGDERERGESAAAGNLEEFWNLDHGLIGVN
jgi:hypothetical protein